MEAPKVDYDLTVLQHQGKSYIKEKYNFKNYLVNGVEVERCKGNSQYGYYDGVVSTIQQKASRGGNIRRWVLKPEWQDLPEEKFPREYAANHFQSYYDDEDDIEERTRSTFYKAEYSQKEEYLTDVSYEIIEVDCEPISLPSYVKVFFPHNLTEFPEFAHKFPCSIPYTSVFALVWAAIRDHVHSYPNVFSMDDFLSIQTLTVKRKIQIPKSLQIEVREEYYPNWNAKKKKTKYVTHIQKEVTVFNLIGKYDRGRDSIQIKEVTGKNWAECQANLQSVIDYYLSFLDPNENCVCETCKGSGIIKKE
jgi:hypothetical protein